jgi:hypothetical protein
MGRKLSQQADLDGRLTHILPADRANIWQSTSNMLGFGDTGAKTIMGLGYVQSGKTTSISALCAMACDRGYRLIIAMLGSTTLLTDQNRTRVEEYLGVENHEYIWKSISKINVRDTAHEIEDYLGRGRTVLVPFIKNASVIDKLSGVLNSLNLDDVKVLIVDDEADQASMNTKSTQGEHSRTYEAIAGLRRSVGEHLFIQYTATPYAPLLLPQGDPLIPDAVEFLRPGKGYTGGREFFIDHRHEVVRPIPEADEQQARGTVSVLPKSFEVALCNYLVGATHLFELDRGNVPISMLVHSSFKTELQKKYLFLIKQYLKQMKDAPDLQDSYFGGMLESERQRLYSLGIQKMNDATFWEKLSFTLRELTLWLVNSASDVKKINWTDAPFHMLIGGNKLDRGFTVEGLTVTYMNRPASIQIDTLEQRARAFGYRTNLIPYCQFFATAKTIKTLTDIVHTEDDLRVSLRDYLEQGKTVRMWADEIGLLLPAGTIATRKSVTPGLNYFNPDGVWQSLRRPSLLSASITQNSGSVSSAFAGADYVQFGRLKFKSRPMSMDDAFQFLENWKFDEASPMWRHKEITDFVRRYPHKDASIRMVLMESPDEPGKPRVRSWADDTGFVNLFQGQDLDFATNPSGYPGDREIWNTSWAEKDLILQVHRVTRRGFDDQDLFTLAIKLQGHAIARRNGENNE